VLADLMTECYCCCKNVTETQETYFGIIVSPKRFATIILIYAHVLELMESDG
jgi:hypothetical protein